MPPRDPAISRPSDSTPARSRPRAQHSLETIRETAIAILDEGGEQALTLRGLAARLGAGVGSLYWYVKSKDELLDLATDHLVTATLERAEAMLARRRTVREDPYARLRLLAIALFDELEAHPWMALYLMRDADAQLGSMRYWERLGQQVLAMGLGRTDAFYATSSLLSYVIGSGAQMAIQGPTPEHPDREGFLGEMAQMWASYPPADFPYLHATMHVFATHDDRRQFTYGLDVLLDGLRARAGAGRR